MKYWQCHKLILTQFGKLAARQLFPCWDDPAFKTTFDIGVKHSEKYTALSNMPSKQNNDQDNDTTMIWSEFDITPMMSIHQLVIVLLVPFTINSNPESHTIYTWCKSNTILTIPYAYHIATKVPNYLLRYTNISLGIPKTDHVVIWDAPYSEAHWGLIIYSESDVIYDEAIDSTVVKIQVANTVASQVAHQWFGGLVTPKSWTHSWLSESFALFFSRYVLDLMHEEWYEIFFMTVENLHDSMREDDDIMPPVLFEINSISDILSLKSTSNVYLKGSALLRMLQHIIGEEIFRKGVMEFLNRHKYGLVTTDDLWFALQVALNATLGSKVDIKKVMDPWMTQKGFPLVTVTRDYVTGKTNISQQPYNTFDISDTISDSSKWWIPVTWTEESFTTFHETSPTLFLGPEDENISIITNPDDWIIVNLQQTGYYRVHYDRTNWEKIANYLKNDDDANIHVLNRAQIIDDICNIFSKGQTDWALFSLVTSYLSRETNYIPWVPMLRCLDMLSIFFPLPESKKFQLHLASYFDFILNDIGYEEDSNEDDLTKKARLMLTFYACTLGNPTCRSTATRKLKKFLIEPKHNILPWWEDWTFCFGMKTANIVLWEHMLQVYAERKSKTMLNSLVCAEDPRFIIKFLHTVIENKTLTERADIPDLINDIIKQHIHNNEIFSYILNKPELLNSAIDILDNIINNLYYEDQLDEVDRLIKTSNESLNRIYVYENKIEQRRQEIRAVKSSFNNTFGKIQLNETKKKCLHGHVNNMRYIKLSLNVGLIIVAFCIKNSKSDSLCETNNHYLPNGIVPKLYNIELVPNMEIESSSFKGNLFVCFELCHATRNVSIYSLNLQIQEKKIFLYNNINLTQQKLEKYNYDIVRQILILHYEEELPRGDYVLLIEFNGIYAKNTGFYTKAYMSQEENQIVAVMQTEEIMARHIFPCWDEPALKANFVVLIKHNIKYQVLSNMPIKQTIKSSTKNMELFENDDIYWTKFEATPLMSTYLIAAVVFDPLYISNVFASKIINVWCRPHLASQIQFVTNIATNIIQHFAHYTSSVDVPTINIVLLPDSSISKIVSSWALIIFRESDLLQYDEDIAGTRRRHIANLFTEHVARYWFGNLVTPYQWSHVWLRNGFATFFASYIHSMIFEHWQSMNLLVVKDIHSALEYDMHHHDIPPVILNTKKFQFSLLKNNKYISHTISQKASAILRMLQFLITEDVFRKGIISYLDTHAYDSVTSDDFWLRMQTVLYKSNVISDNYKIKEVMDTYTKQSRYPLVLVKRNYTTGETIISQKCFAPQNVIDNTTWWIPISFTTQTDLDFLDTTPLIWLKPQDENITLQLKPNDWIVVNLQQYGYYRVNYDETNWRRIADYLNSNEYIKIHTLNRAQLINDAFALVRYNKIKISIFMSITGYLSRETNYAVWYSVFKILELSSEYFLLPESRNLKLHFSEILGNRLEKLGYDEDPHEHDFKKLERLNATHWACYFGNSKCRSAATFKLNNYLTNPANYKILPHWQEWIYCAGLMEADMTFWNKTFIFIKNLISIKDNQRLLEFLACVEDSEIIINYLNIWRTLPDSLVQTYGLDIIFYSIVNKHARNDNVLNYIIDHFHELIPKASLSYNVIHQLILHIYSSAQLDKVEHLASIEFKSQPDIWIEIQDIIEVRKYNLAFQQNFFGEPS
nr:PREDICTED: aminopeptidase N-like [Linepithema humile]